MKKQTGTLILCLIFCIAAIHVNAQRGFSGVVEYKISYGEADLDPATLAMLPRSITVEIDGNKSRMEQQQGVTNVVKITDADNFSSIVLLDIMGMKYAIRTSKEEIEMALKEMPVPEIAFVDETKQIAGIEAKKAILTFTDEDGNVSTEEVYYTPEIGGADFNFDTPYRGIPGLLLEYSNDSELFKSTLIAQSIERKRRIRPTTFMIPEDYKEVSPEELQQIFEGMQ